MRRERHPSDHPVARLAAASTVSGAATVGTVALGGALPHRPTAGTGLAAWAGSTPPDALAANALWALLLALAAYLTALHLVATVAAALRWGAALELTERASFGLISRLGAGSVIAGLSGVLLASVPASATTDATGGDPVMQLVEGGQAGDTAPTMVLTPPSDPPAPIMQLIPGDIGPAAPATGPGAEPTDGPADVAGSDRSLVAAPGGRWTVRAGDNLWDIAEAVLVDAAGAPVELEAVHAYWLRVIEANRHQLADPTNPDLLFSGQPLELPAR